MLLLWLIWLYVSCIDAVLDHHYWTKHIDRLYTRKMIHPYVAKIGRKTPVLEIGMEANNVDDCTRLHMPCSNFYINDIVESEDYSLAPGKGTFLKGSFASLATKGENLNKFGVIYDFGVLGFRTWTWSDEDIQAHVMAYPKLLKHHGVLLLKWDLGFRTDDHFSYWVKVEELLRENMAFVGRHILHNNKCDERLVEKYKNDNKASLSISHGYIGNFFDNEKYQPPEELQTECEMFLFSQWTNGEIPIPGEGNDEL